MSDDSVDWMRPQTWPRTVRVERLAYDFQTLLAEGFGVQKGTLPLLTINLDDIVIPEIDYSDDRDYDPETGEPWDRHVTDMMEAMQNGVTFPPVVIGEPFDSERWGKRWGHPYDGRHRLNAAARLGLRVVPAIDISHAAKHGLGATRGKRAPRHPRIVIPCGDCFRWAVQRAGELEAQGIPVRVVHGLAGPRSTPHAWVEFNGPNGETQDWQREVMNLEPLPTADFYFQLHPKQVKRYTHLEALKLSVSSGHWGPW